MKRFLPALAAAGLLGSLCAVELPSIFGDNMVLQRDREIRIWGKGSPGEKIKVEFKGKEASVETGADSKWMVTLPALPASKDGAELTVTGDNKVELNNVLVGDVWLCAGQSNMQWALKSITGAKEHVDAADRPAIRLFRIDPAWNRDPQDDNAKAKWEPSNPKTVANFSAVGYLVGSAIQEKTGVPVGLISIAWGGARIEAMSAPESYREAGLPKELIERFEGEIGNLRNTADENLRKDKQRLPIAVFNAMVHPITPLSVRGMLWYQGEDNHSEGMRYAEKLRALAWTWRTYFRNPDMPVFIVMLPPWNYHGDQTGRLPRFWQAQQYFAEHDKNAGFIVTTDCGNPEDIHPRDKAPLANRLANLVLYKEYGIGDTSVLSPTLEKVEVREGTVLVSFKNDNGLTTRDGKPVSHLELAGADGKFHPATGKLYHGRMDLPTGSVEFDWLEVSSDEVKAPAKIRFGFDQVANPNLVNRAGVPAAPFEAEVSALK